MNISVTRSKVTIEKESLNKGEYNVRDCVFTFSEEYEGLILKALFTIEDTKLTYEQSIVNNICTIPYEATVSKSKVTLGVIGYSVEDEELVKRYSPAPDEFFVYEGSYIEDIENQSTPTPSQLDQIDQRVSDLEVDNVTNKQDIADIKAEQITQNTAIETNTDNISSLTNRVGDLETDNATNKQDISNIKQEQIVQNTAISNKVDKVEGKGLSTEDYTTADKNKLAGIETGAEVNVIEDVKVNGTAQTVENKEVDITVPTALSDLSEDSTHRTVTDEEKTTWNNKSDFSGNYNDLSNKPDLSEFITKDVDNLTNYTLKTATGSLIDLEINGTTYVVTLSLKDQDGNVISSDTIDLPLESVVVGGSYDSVNQKIVLTLENGNTVDIPVGALVAGLQTEITSQNKLASDLVDDSNSGNKFVTTSEKTAWNAKYDKPAGGIPSTDLADSVLADYVKNTDYATTSKGGVIKVGGYGSKVVNGALAASALPYDSFKNQPTDYLVSKGSLDNYVAGKNLETANNKVTSISSSSTDTEYPSAKCVYDIEKTQDDLFAELQEQYNAMLRSRKYTTGSGENVTLEDTAEGIWFRKFGISGNSKQETYTGKNLLEPMFTTPKTSNGVTVTLTNKGWKIDGTSTSTYSYFEICKKEFQADTYVINGISGSGTTKYLLEVAINGTSQYYVMTSKQIITLTETSTISFRLYCYPGYGTFNGLILPYQLEIGTVPTDTYEPYCRTESQPLVQCMNVLSKILVIAVLLILR